MYFVFFLQTVNTTNKMEMLREKKTQNIKRSKAIKTKQNGQ